MTTTKYPASLVNGINDLLTSMFCGMYAGVVVAKDFTICGQAAKGFTINSLNCATSAGTATLAVKINGVAVTGLSAVSASSVRATTSASGGNTVVTGDLIVLSVTSPSGDCADLDWTVAITEPSA